MIRPTVKTKDGTYSLLDHRTQETYHSIHGAHNESMHVFIENGLKWVAEKQTDIHILEIGLGTGYNAVLTQEFALKQQLNVHYTAIEKYPLVPEEWESLATKTDQSMYRPIHEADWGCHTNLSEAFSITKHQIDFMDIAQLALSQIDLIYYDAFSPTSQPELWTIETLNPIVATLATEGVLVTYCAQGQFRRNLEYLGLQTQRLPGPPGKREMIRAVKL